jgi:hypothetical protein
MVGITSPLGIRAHYRDAPGGVDESGTIDPEPSSPFQRSISRFGGSGLSISTGRHHHETNRARHRCSRAGGGAVLTRTSNRLPHEGQLIATSLMSTPPLVDTKSDELCT